MRAVVVAPAAAFAVFMQMHQTTDVIVVGGGVAGLAAAGELGRQGIRVVLLEGRRRLGGRILTERRAGWHRPVELGAQFVHGGNEALWTLLERHQIKTERVPGRHWRQSYGGWMEIDATKRIAEVTRRIDEKRMAGWSFARFMRQTSDYLDPIDRDLAMGFVEGFEAAPANRMSAIAVAGETLEDDEQYVIPSGYDTVVAALAGELTRKTTSVLLDARCSSVTWKNGSVQVRSQMGTFSAPAVVITIPVSLLQRDANARSGLLFSPSLGRRSAALRKIGMGHVVRLTLRLDGRRWRRLLPQPLADAADRGFGFIHARGEGIPVWWSLRPEPLLTGWCGGPAAMKLARQSERAILHCAVETLAELLQRSPHEVASVVCDAALHNWTHDPFSRGAYSFTLAGGDDAAQRAREPIGDTLFFAGEATADGAEVGTVHGALASGLRAARQVRDVLQTASAS